MKDERIDTLDRATRQAVVYMALKMGVKYLHYGSGLKRSLRMG